ncbi:hypothetical protein MPSEU_000946500 [Mayamaea pseudoterrestris]|nr:hypothetical protein MPSEU_000946500 [Mayamaea pseudoterrestris]
MALPARSASHSPSTTSPWILFTVKLLMVLLILFMLPKLVFAADGRSRRSHTNRNIGALKTITTTCATEICNYLIDEENMNCVNACLSPACFQQVFGDSPLEDGEIDLTRAREYDLCLKEEIRVASQRTRREKKRA